MLSPHEMSTWIADLIKLSRVLSFERSQLPDRLLLTAIQDTAR